MMFKNILCDRDGTIIYDKHYLCNPEGVELLPGAGHGLQRLTKAGCDIFVVTNQSGIGRGIFSLEQYYSCSDRLVRLLNSYAVSLQDTVFCPHTPNNDVSTCDCRKPDIGMWRTLERRHALHSSQSVMIGDKYADIMFGKNAVLGATVLVLTGKGEMTAKELSLPVDQAFFEKKGFYTLPKSTDKPDCVALNLDAAADYILNKNKTE